MSFLHRLHPGRALEPGAVRADIAPRFAPPAPLPAVAAVAWPAAAPAARAETAMPAERDVPRPPVEPMAAAPATAPSVTPLPPVTVMKTPLPAPALPQHESDTAREPALAAQAAPASPAHAIERTVQHQSGSVATGAAAPAAAATPVVTVVAPAGPRAVDTPVQRSNTARAPSPQAPLRAAAVPRTAAAPAPTVVRVSIDRLDVRLPVEPAAAAPPAARRPRSGAGPSLGDYLRGKSGGAR
jgi:hypothetical protein